MQAIQTEFSEKCAEELSEARQKSYHSKNEKKNVELEDKNPTYNKWRFAKKLRPASFASALKCGAP